MRVRLAGALIVAALLLCGCGPASPGPARSPSAAAPTIAPPTATSAAPTRTPVPSATPTPPADPIARLTLAQRVGQLFMVGTTTTAADPATIAAVTGRHVGGVFLRTGARGSVAQIAALVARFTALVSPATTGGVPLWVATDQEGGQVQVLSGPGFDRIPSALAQGRMPRAALQADAAAWGGQLARAGVNVDLAPVADIVTSAASAAANKPIGALAREYGFDEHTVAAGAGAFAAGLRQAGILPTFKHFPGLGRTSTNTDFAPAVDAVIGPASPDVDVYRGLTGAGPALVMVSTAVYQRIDPSAPAAFSPAVVTGLLRGRVGFGGVVITDDLSAAAAVERWTPAQRAALAVAAGCDILLVSADPAVLPPMYDAVLAKARSDPAFAALVDAAARRVVEAKRAPAG